MTVARGSDSDPDQPCRELSSSSNARKSAKTAFKDAGEAFADLGSREEQNNDETSCSIGVAIRGG
jgi:hypothetical protein